MILASHGIISSGISQFTSGLLDTYTGAAAAYSLRRLSIAYTGSAIRVRRASDNTELDIGFNGENLNTAALTSFCSGTNGFVKTWYDQSGNGRHETQTVSSQQPKIYDSIAGVVINPDNNKPSIFLDGADDGFSVNLSMPSLQRFEAFSVLKTNDTQGLQYCDNSQNFRWVFILDSGSTNTSISGSFSIDNIYKNNVLQTLTTRGAYYTAFGDNITHLSFLQGSLVGNWTRLSLFDYQNSSFNLGGYSQEIVIWFSSVTNTNKNGISTNINDYYGIY